MAVVPLQATTQAPDTRHGFKDATTDPATIRGWWTGGPDRNVAIRTGWPGPDVLDIDVKADGDGDGALARLKRARLTGDYEHGAGCGSVTSPPPGGTRDGRGP